MTPVEFAARCAASTFSAGRATCRIIALADAADRPMAPKWLDRHSARPTAAANSTTYVASGAADGEIIRRVFLEFLRQEGD